MLPALGAENATTSPAAATDTPLDWDRLLADPAELSDRLATEREGLSQAIDAAQDALDRAAAHLAMANWLLSAPAARPATRWVIGADRPEDRRTLAESSKAARDQLDKAAELLKGEGTNPESNADKTRRRRFQETAETLRAFADFFAMNDAGADPKPADWAEAAIGLSEARESDQAPVASAATLWQALAWHLAGRSERALATLPDALARPDQAGFDFLSRLLRCRVLAESDQPAGAMALLIRIRAQCDNWFTREKAVGIAARQRLAGVLQLRLAEEWAGRLRTTTQPANADLLTGPLAQVRKELAPEGGKLPVVYHLEQAVPVLAKPPAAKPAASAPASSSAPSLD